MSEHHNGLSDDGFREVMRRWEAERAPVAPSFDAISRHIDAAPSPLDAPRWGALRSLRLAAALAWVQIRVVPWLVLPVVLATAAMAIFAARFLGVNLGASAAVIGFSALMLFGVAATVTMALSPSRSDAVSLATPLGPQVVVLARILIVLLLDAVAGTVASILVSFWGYTGNLSAVLAGWLVPLAMIAGAATFVAIWTVPWAGMLTGLVLIPFASPAAESTMSMGLGAFSGVLWEALTPVGVVVAGALLFVIAIATARLAATRSWAAAELA